jgi:hypothetical protein
MIIVSYVQVPSEQPDRPHHICQRCPCHRRWLFVAVQFRTPFNPAALNTFLLQKIPYVFRVGGNATMMAAGLVAIAFAPNFWLALVAIVCRNHSLLFISLL